MKLSERYRETAQSCKSMASKATETRIAWLRTAEAYIKLAEGAELIEESERILNYKLSILTDISATRMGEGNGQS